MSPNVAELVAALSELENDEVPARQDPLRDALADLRGCLGIRFWPA